MPANCDKPRNFGRIRSSSQSAAVLHDALWGHDFDVPYTRCRPTSRHARSRVLVHHAQSDRRHARRARSPRATTGCQNLPTILNSTEYQGGSTAIFITWDEGAAEHQRQLCCQYDRRELPGGHIVDQPEHGAGNELCDAVQPLLAAGYGRAVAWPAEAWSGREQHDDDGRVQPLIRVGRPGRLAAGP